MSDTPTPDTTLAERTDPSLGLDPLSQMAGGDAPALSEAEFQDRWAATLGQLEGQFSDDSATTVDESPVGEQADSSAIPTEDVPLVASEGEPDTPTGDEGVAASSAGVFDDLGIDEATARQIIEAVAALPEDQARAIFAPPPQQAAFAPPPPGAQPAASGYGTPASDPAAGAGAGLPAAGQPGVPVLPDLAELGQAFPELGTYLNEVGSYVGRVASQQELMQAELQRQADYYRQQTEARINEELAVGRDEFKGRYSALSDADLQTVERRAAALSVMPALMAQHGQRADLAYVEAMEMALWSDPSLRDRLVQSRVNEAAAASEQIAEKRGRAAALSTGGGSVPREPAAAPAPKTPAERQAAMAAELAQMIAARS